MYIAPLCQWRRRVQKTHTHTHTQKGRRRLISNTNGGGGGGSATLHYIEGCQQVARRFVRDGPTFADRPPPPPAVLIVERRPQSTRTGVRGVTHCTLHTNTRIRTNTQHILAHNRTHTYKRPCARAHTYTLTHTRERGTRSHCTPTYCAARSRHTVRTPNAGPPRFFF